MEKSKSGKIYYAFLNAFEGLTFFFRQERNGRIQLLIGLLTIAIGILLKVSVHEWVIILICIGAVLSAEMMNSALEKLCDHLHPSIHLQIKIVKDVAAGGVLFISLISLVIGAIIFTPKIWQLL